MLLHVLTPHPDTPSSAIERIEATLGEDEGGCLRPSYRLIGRAQSVIAMPCVPGRQPERRDGLWRHTCCELFVQDAAGSGYREYNFAPSGDWAAYRFSDYRTGQTALEATAPRIVLERSPDVLVLTVTLDDLPLAALRARQIGIACIVETAAESSYWALAHPPGRPDFHHACTFVPMPALERAADYVR